MRIYILTILIISFFNSSLGQVVLPAVTTTLSKTSLPTGFTHSGLGPDYSGPKLKFDGIGDVLIVHLNGQPGDLRFDLGTNNNFTGSVSNSTEFQVLESSSGASYTSVFTEGNGSTFIRGSKTVTTLNSTTRYIKFEFTNKISLTNVALYNIEIDAGTSLSTCTAPSDPTAISFPIISSNTIEGQFSASADGYLVLRTLTATAPTVVNGTSYSSVNAPASSSFESDGTSKNFSSSGLSNTTLYYYHVYAYTSAGCSGGPVYSGALSDNARTIGPLTNIKTRNFDATNDLTAQYSSGVLISNSSTTNPVGNSFGHSGNGAVVNNNTDTISTCPYEVSTVSEFEFKLASLSSTTGNGADNGDYVAVDISVNGGTTYTTVMTVTGASNSRWLYTAVDSAVTSYSSPASDNPSGGGNTTNSDGIGKVKITAIPAGDIAIRIRLSNNASAEYWVVDDLKLKSATGSTSDLIARAVSNESISNTGITSTLVWDNPNCYSNVVIIAKEGSSPTFDPATNACSGVAGDCTASDFTASSTFAGAGSNTDLPSSEYCVYNGSGESVTISGLNTTTTYHYEIFTYLNPWSSKVQSPDINIVSLPVDLISFDGKLESNLVSLDWSTASEQSNLHFDIYKSLNGIDFHLIGRVEGGGNSQTILAYNFIDSDVNALQYYKLKQVDYNGSFEYSDVIKVSSAKGSFDYVRQTREEIILNTEDIARVVVVNQQGQILLDKQISSETVLRKSDYKSGIYIIRVYHQYGIQTLKWTSVR
jgi:hypothetical protein